MLNDDVIAGDGYIELDESQWWPLKKLENFQNEMLKKMISYAYNHIPAYRKKMDRSGIEPNDIDSIKDLWKVPITSREEMQDNQDFVNKDLIAGTLYTGGSTGSSLKYYESEQSGKIRWNSHLRGWSWNGYTLSKKLAVISSAQGNIETENTLNLTGDLTTENLEQNIKKLLDFRPQHIRGYVSSIYILAKYCLDNSVKIDGVESINPISENLYDFQRELIENAFNCRVFEEYCCNDGGACAWECEAHQGLHYFMERAVIEDIDGEMVVTDLWNRAMPFIRYRNGDAVIFLNKECDCGRKLPLIKVKGRTNDVLITTAGLVSPTYIMHHGIGIMGIGGTRHNFRSGIRTVQYVQRPHYVLDVNIVKNPWCTEDEIRSFRIKIDEIVRGMEVRLNFVDEIPGTAKGKRQFIINEDKELLKKYNLQHKLNL